MLKTRVVIVEMKSQPKFVLKICKVSEKGIVPKRATNGSAGMDLHACIDESIVLNPGERVFIKCGIAIGLPEGYAAFVFPRSGLGVKHGITLSNCVGVIDSDYRGEIGVGLYNLSDIAYTINPNERIAQMVVMPVCMVETKEVEFLDETERGAGGFGSTGK